jgi:uncharacterized protein (DUF433 family)
MEEGGRVMTSSGLTAGHLSGEARDAVEVSASGVPVIKGTSLLVYEIAALASHETVEEIAEDYPSLSHDQIEAAIAYARVYPQSDRAYPDRSFKRAVAELGLDEITAERTNEGPRLLLL